LEVRLSSPLFNLLALLTRGATNFYIVVAVLIAGAALGAWGTMTYQQCLKELKRHQKNAYFTRGEGAGREGREGAGQEGSGGPS